MSPLVSIMAPLAHIAGAAASVAGNFAGHRLAGRISEQHFRAAFKIMVTLAGLRLLKGNSQALDGLRPSVAELVVQDNRRVAPLVIILPDC